MTARPRPSAVAAGAAAVLATAGLVALATGGTGSPDREPLPSSGSPAAAQAISAAPAPTSAAGDAGAREPLSPEALAAGAAAGKWTAQMLRPAMLRTGPGGPMITRVSRQTGYGIRRVYAVAALRPGWVGVRALQRPNGKLGWLPADVVRLEPIRMTLVADLSERELSVRIDGEVRRRFGIGIGRPGSTTPLGRYGVTDRLRAGRSGAARAAYGCCVLPLTGHQPNPPPGWKGGTRLAIHGTPRPGSVGRAVSSGCLRMDNRDARRLMASVPLGTTLTVRR